jgi:hypothetical protein
VTLGWSGNLRDFTQAPAIGLEDALYLPVGGVETWHLSDLSSALVGLVNGTTLTATANHSIVEASLFGNSKGVHCNATSIFQTTAPEAALTITGDMTFEMILHCHAKEGQLGGGQNTFFAYTANSESEADNALYQLFTDDNRGGGFLYLVEQGGGTNVTLTGGNAIPYGRIFHLAFTRESNECKVYVDGNLLVNLGTASASPTGGSTAKLYVASHVSGLALNATIWSIRIKDTADSASAVRSTYDATLGQKWPLST